MATLNKEENKNLETIMYTQLQPWSSVRALPCMEQISGPQIPVRTGEYYRTPRPHPWRPTLGYENVEVTPLPTQSLTNQLVDPCYTSNGMATEPLRFPNLVTGFERNPAHAARAALYTRYTPYEWVENQRRVHNEANSNRHTAEKLRTDTALLLRVADETVEGGQRDTGRKLGERITDVTFWRNEVALELDRLITENDKTQECYRVLQKAIQDLDGQLHIAQECLYYRESRKGTELVHDQTEQALLKEVETVRISQKRLEQFTEKCIEQLSNGRASRAQLETDIRNKEGALGIDIMCHQLNNFSRGLQYYGGIEKYNLCVIEADSWAEASNITVKKSQIVRSRSCQLRTDIEVTINGVAQDMWDAWSSTNNALARRSAEMLEAKSKLQIYLRKIQKEIFDIEKNLELIGKAMADKSSVLKVAHSRLEARTHRQELELCNDYAQRSMVDEVNAINGMISGMHMKMQQCEAQHQQLLRTRATLETDLKAKVDALFIDREKCMGMRRSYPISSTIKY